MHRNVELLIGRLATDTRLRRRFARNAKVVLLDLIDQGLDLNEVELEALASLDLAALDTFALAIDARLRKAYPLA